MSVQLRNQSGLLERVAGFNDTDAVLSPTSRNPVQNKTIYNALSLKIEKTVDDLVNYYTTAQCYNKQEVRELIGAINTLTIEVVAALPTTDISATTIYFVGPATGTNTYDEYVYVGSAWVKIGDTNIDLSSYVTSANLTTALQSYYTKSELNTLLDTNYYDKGEINDLLDAKEDIFEFDSTPTAGSSNPVTSTGIKTALDTKQNNLTFDTTPIAGSTNPITSGGVKSAIDAAASTPVDVVENGNMHAVTSNAVFDHLFGLFQPIERFVSTDTSIDLNNCTTGGFANFLISPVNPHSCGSYGYLLVLRYGSTSNPNLCQVHFPYHSGDQFAIRCRFSGSWTNWKLYGAV